MQCPDCGKLRHEGDCATDKYSYWRDALDGIFGPVHDSDPQCGFWRLRSKAGEGKRGAAKFIGASAVAIWDDSGTIVASVDGMKADANDLWLIVARYPIAEEDYRQHRDTGVWRDVAAMDGAQ